MEQSIFDIRSGIQIPLIWYIAVADRFTRIEITYIQVTLPPYLKLHNANIFRVPLYKATKWGLHPYIFNVTTRFSVHYIPRLQKNLVSLRCRGGGGCMVAICSPSPIKHE